jgi:Major Facilitator Superfamily
VGTLAGFVVLILARSPGEVLFARIIDGATAGNLAVVNAAVCDVYPLEARAGRFSMMNTASGAGLLAGLGLCAALATHGFATLAGIAAAAAGITIVAGLVARFPPASVVLAHVRPGRLLQLLRPRGPLSRPGAATFFVQLLIGAFALTLPALLHAAIGAAERTGVVVAAIGLLVGVLVQATVGVRLNRRVGSRLTVALSAGAVEAGVLLLALSSAWGSHEVPAPLWWPPAC